MTPETQQSSANTNPVGPVQNSASSPATLPLPALPLLALPLRIVETLWVFLCLGCTSFGGPLAHFGYFRREFVERRGWINAERYARIMALAQILPGPASSQTGFAIGLARAGWLGGLAAWIGFTLPSAILMTLYALGEQQLSHGLPVRYAALLNGALHGLQLAAVVVIGQATYLMGRPLWQEKRRMLILLVGCIVSGWLHGTVNSILPIVLGAVLGALLLKSNLVQQNEVAKHEKLFSRTSGIVALALFTLVVLALPWLARSAAPGPLLSAFGRTGALVFGGGHVVLPVLYQETVARGWLSESSFLSGYGVAQALPGPLFTLAAYLGATGTQSPSGLVGAMLATVAIFLPGLLLMAGMLPFWEWVAESRPLQNTFAGIQAAVIGLLLMAFVQAFHTSARSWQDYLLCLIGFATLVRFKVQPWLFVLAMAATCALLNLK